MMRMLRIAEGGIQPSVLVLPSVPEVGGHGEGRQEEASTSGPDTARKPKAAAAGELQPVPARADGSDPGVDSRRVQTPCSLQRRQEEAIQKHLLRMESPRRTPPASSPSPRATQSSPRKPAPRLGARDTLREPVSHLAVAAPAASPGLAAAPPPHAAEFRSQPSANAENEGMVEEPDVKGVSSCSRS